jgi:hypothetical protein
MKKIIISALVMIGSLAQASSNYDVYFKTLDEAQAIERRVLNTPEKTVGPLMNLYICVSTNIVTNQLSKKMQESYSNSALEAFASIPFGGEILDAFKKEDPNFLNFDLEQTQSGVACSNQLEIVNMNSKIPKKSIAEVVKLAEVGGMFLGAEMTSGIE